MADGMSLDVSAIDPAAIDAVVFDMGGVFVVPNPDAMVGILAEVGISLADATPRAAAAHYRGVRALTDVLATRSFREHELDVWEIYDRSFFPTLGVAEDEVDHAVAARARQRSAGQSNQIWTHRLTENIAAFAALVAVGIPTAIVTNNDGTAVEQCHDLGICQIGPGPLPEVAAIVDSTVVGIAKPDPAIFAPALDALDVAPGRALYIGDTVHADVHGATAAGMPVVQLDPLDLHADHHHARLPDLPALVELFQRN